MTSSEQLAAAPKSPDVPFEMLVSTDCQGDQSCLKSTPIYKRIMQEVTAAWQRGTFSEAVAGGSVWDDDPVAAAAVGESTTDPEIRSEPDQRSAVVIPARFVSSKATTTFSRDRSMTQVYCKTTINMPARATWQVLSTSVRPTRASSWSKTVRLRARESVRCARLTHAVRYYATVERLGRSAEAAHRSLPHYD